MITVASEVMAILCLATDITDLKNRLGKIIIGYSRSGKILYASDLKAQGAMAALLKDAIKPNLVQTLENTPCLIHGGPFANIAHGCNSVRATRLALKLADYVITEAGFGSDLGAEKFLDIKCRYAGLTPNAIVLVATIRALKYNGGIPKDKCSEPNLAAMKAGMVNLEAHIENLQMFGVPVVVAINRFAADTDEEIAALEEFCKEKGADFALSEVFAKGGEGGRDLAAVTLPQRLSLPVKSRTASTSSMISTNLSRKRSKRSPQKSTVQQRFPTPQMPRQPSKRSRQQVLATFRSVLQKPSTPYPMIRTNLAARPDSPLLPQLCAC